jgi:hypothetical protein
MNSAEDTLAGGLPHSEIPGSTIARISPGLFAACHVLHRLSVPRHPPDALLMLLAPHPTANITGVRRNPRVSPKAIDAPGLTRGPSGPALGAARATPVAVGGTVVPPWQSSPFRRHFVTEPAGPENPIKGPRPPLPSRSQLASSQLSISNTPPGRKAGRGNSYHLPRCLRLPPAFGETAFRLSPTSLAGQDPAVRRLLSQTPVGSVELGSTGGGGERARTVDLRLAKPALSQLSYTPVPEDRDQGSELQPRPLRPSPDRRAKRF